MKRLRRKFTHTTNLDSICSAADILAELLKHEQVLLGTDVERLVYFSRTYAITNSSISQAITDGYFSNPVMIRRLQIQFAKKYFNTLNDYASTGLMPRQWWVATSHRLMRLQPAGLSLFFAIKAHIQCDAVPSLRRISIEPILLKDDYRRVNKLLLKSSREIVKSYNPDSRLSLVREIARKALIVPIYFVVLLWRRKAWHNFSTGSTHSRKHETNLSTKINFLQNSQVHKVRPAYIDRIES